jgi:hypothetical protein
LQAVIEAVCLLLARDPYGWEITVWPSESMRLVHHRLVISIWLHASGSVHINERRLTWLEARRLRKALNLRMKSVAEDLIIAKLDLE